MLVLAFHFLAGRTSTGDGSLFLLDPRAFDLSLKKICIYICTQTDGDMDECWRLCEAGCAYHGITDFVTNTLMKVQHVAVSENSVHNSCVLFTVIWTLRYSLGQRDGICSMD